MNHESTRDIPLIKYDAQSILNSFVNGIPSLIKYESLEYIDLICKWNSLTSGLLVVELGLLY